MHPGVCNHRSSSYVEAPSTADLKKDMRNILSLDEFEECRARATSGGSMYGLMRRQALIRGSASCKAAAGRSGRPMERQRSRSMFQRSVAHNVAHQEDKGILRMLCEYTEMKKMLRDSNRRHSEAAIPCNRQSSFRANPTSSNRLRRTLTPGRYSRSRTGVPTYAAGLNNLSVPGGSVLMPPPPAFLQPSPVGHPDMARLSLSGPPSFAFCRRRSFSLTQNGLVNDGDEVVTLPTSPNSISGGGGGSAFSPSAVPPIEGDFIPGVCYGTAQRSRAASVFSRAGDTAPDAVAVAAAAVAASVVGCPSRQPSISPEALCFRVLMLGGPGVGKTALAQQFVTSEYMAAQNTSFDDGIEIPIPVLYEGEESIVEFIDLPYSGELNTWREYDVDGYIIVYSITDRRSYQKAVDLLYSIREECDPAIPIKPIIVVANKSDLERSRIVGKEEGRTIAETYGSKYIDVSAILNHKVDDLLVGILKQIRLNKDALLHHGRYRGRLRSRDDSSEIGCFSRASSKGSLLRRLVRKTSRRRSRSCENLLRL